MRIRKLQVLAHQFLIRKFKIKSFDFGNIIWIVLYVKGSQPFSQYVLFFLSFLATKIEVFIGNVPDMQAPSLLTCKFRRLG